MARPIEFDKDNVLKQVLNTFWQQGYCATSISDLVEVTQVKRGSLYAAFQSKQELLLASIDLYGQLSVEHVQHCLDQANTPLEGIKAYFKQLEKEAIKDRQRRGCFLVNTMLELGSHNEDVRTRLNIYLEAIETCFRKALQSACVNGELPPEKDPAALAKFLMASIWGIRVLNKIRSDKKTFNVVINQLLTVLGA